MTEIAYPRRDVRIDEVFNQATFDLATAQIFSWRQAAGAFGNLHLHACWGETSTLGRRYHGQTVSDSLRFIEAFMTLYQRTGQPRWRLLVEDVAANVLFLQAAEGGFYHASSEFEPTYTCTETCPIHQGLPLLALLSYAAWEHADPVRRDAARRAIDAHLRWFLPHTFRTGTPFSGRLKQAGYCGVTNQDLVIVAVLARYAALFGDDSLYPQYGQDVLDAYLSPAYYHAPMGLFERGDRPNFAERTSYYDIIVAMLELIHRHRPDARIPGVIDNVARHLFDAVHVGKDGMTHLAWGALTDETDKRAIRGWARTPHTFRSYPQLLQIMGDYLRRHPDQHLQAQHDALERTLAAYVFADGSIPIAVGGDDATLAAASRAETLWSFLIERLGADLRDPAPVRLPIIRRTAGPVTFTSSAAGWTIHRDGRRWFAGWKNNPSAIALGPDESLANADMQHLDTPDLHERI